MYLQASEVIRLEDWQLENLMQSLESFFELNQGILFFEDIVREFCPDIAEEDLKYTILEMYEKGQITTDGDVLRLIVR